MLIFNYDPLSLRKIALLLFTTIICLTSIDVSANPEVYVEMKYYRIEGNTAEDLRNEMNLKSPFRQNDKISDAYTSWYVRWQYRWETINSYCAIATVSTKVEVTFTLPNWINHNTAEKKLMKKWDNYYTALIAHENGHKDLGIKAAKEIENAISNMAHRKNCDILERDVNNLGNKILDKYRALEKQYDIRTNHGMKFGAVFP